MTVDVGFAAGSAIVVRDEEWIVSSCERAGEGWRVHRAGSTELVHDTAGTSAMPGFDDLRKALVED